jgi:3-oxoadipate enol-lactonase
MERKRMKYGMVAMAMVFSALGCASVPVSTTETLEADTGRVTVQGGGSLYYEAAGNGPVVVLAHGGFGDRRMWDAQFGELAREFRVIRYDHRGFGRSPAPTAPYSPVQDLVTLLDALKVERAHFVGNSLSGTLAIDAALRIPERLRSIVVIASGPGGIDVPKEDSDRILAVFRMAATAGTDSAAALWLKHPMIKVSSKAAETRDLVRAMVHDNREIFRMQFWPGEVMNPPAVRRLGEVHTPTLIIAGAEDTPLSRNASFAAAKGIIGVQMVTIAGADHLPQLTHASEVNHLLREFLRAH